MFFALMFFFAGRELSVQSTQPGTLQPISSFMFSPLWEPETRFEGSVPRGESSRLLIKGCVTLHHTPPHPNSLVPQSEGNCGNSLHTVQLLKDANS